MKKFIWIGFILFVAFIGCDLVSRDFSLAEDDFIDPNKGSLVLILDGGAIPTKTIAPTLDMNVATYELIFAGPDVLVGPDLSGSFTTTIGSSGLYVQSGFEPGPNWTVEVNARNGDATPVVIGAINGVQGTTASFPITAGAATPLTVNVVPITGSGDLTLTLTWPDIAVASESITASLTPAPPGPGDISSGLDPGFSMSTDLTTYTAVYDTTLSGTDLLTPLDNGYYTLILQLNDGGALAWGWMEAVRIVTGQTTIYPWDLQLTAGGRLDLITNMQDPIVITFSPTNPDGTTLSQSASTPTDVTVTAVPTPAGSYTYQWYADGSVISGETAASITITGSTYSLGNHNFAVMITDTVSGALSSETFTIEIVL